MKNILRLLSLFSLFFVLIFRAFAIDAPINFKIDNINETSIDLSWDKVEDAYMYYVYYSKNSGLENGYDDYVDVIEGNSVNIENLASGTTYYFAVVSIDENAIESSYSEELVVNTLSSESKNFVLEAVNVISYNTIELDFSNQLENSSGAIREFKIINKNDSLDFYNVVSSTINENDASKLILVLDKDTKVGSEYEVVVISIADINGNNIESGIDSTETFIVEEIVEEPVDIEKEVVEEPVETNDNLENIEEIIDLNSAKEKPVGPTGANISDEKIENTTLMLAKNNDNLPKTGPEHILILILSIILGSLIFIFKYKKA